MPSISPVSSDTIQSRSRSSLASATQVNWRRPARDNPHLDTATPGRTAETVGGIGQKFFFAGLWCVGLVQQYRLLDWIDDRNFHVALTVTETTPAGTTVHPGHTFVPDTMRGSLTLAYIAGATWLPVPAEQLRPLRERIHTRLANRYARRTGRDAEVTVTATVQRIDPSNPTPAQHLTLTTFRCTGGTVTDHTMDLDL